VPNLVISICEQVNLTQILEKNKNSQNKQPLKCIFDSTMIKVDSIKHFS
jgi:hypothetical protein